MNFPVEVFFLILDAFIERHGWRNATVYANLKLTCTWFRAYIVQRVPFVLSNGHIFAESEVYILDTLYNALRNPVYKRPIVFSVQALTFERTARLLLYVSQAIVAFSDKRVGFSSSTIGVTQQDVLSVSQYATLCRNCVLKSDVYFMLPFGGLTDADCDIIDSRHGYQFVFYTSPLARMWNKHSDYTIEREDVLHWLTGEQLSRLRELYQLRPEMNL
jgi:hypothetical protein